MFDINLNHRQLPYPSLTFDIGSLIRVITIEDPPGQYHPRPLSVMIMPIEDTILTQGERYVK